MPKEHAILRPAVPGRISACLFDLDGVLTQTAKLHAAAWKQMFDDFLRKRADQTGAELRAFALPADYDRSVDGKLRSDGVRVVSCDARYRAAAKVRRTMGRRSRACTAWAPARTSWCAT